MRQTLWVWVLCAGLGCASSVDKLPLGPIPLVYENGLLYARGEISPTLGEACDTAPEENAPLGSGVSAILLDVATPLTAFAPAVSATLREFPHGQFLLQHPLPDGQAGSVRLARCDVPVVRTQVAAHEFVLGWGKQPPLALGGVLGGDQLLNYAMQFRFTATGPEVLFSRGDLATACKVNRAVLPFRPLGGEVAVVLEDTIVQYPASRITLGACVEPRLDPLPGKPCISEAELSAAKTRLVALAEQLAKDPNRDEEQLDRIKRQVELVAGLGQGMCTDDDAAPLGDLADEWALRDPAYSVSGTNMRFLLSTALPELVLTDSACRRLRKDGAGCSCDAASQVELTLPGLNQVETGSQTQEASEPKVRQVPDMACRIVLGDAEHAAFALVARQKQLSPCEELARSRRQRYALRPIGPGTAVPEACLRKVCLQDLGRDATQLARRCGYTGLDPELACDDKRAPVAALVELWGKSDADPDRITALVVPDHAALIQAAQADVRNSSAQIDGVLGVSVLARLATTIDYPQGRVEVACRVTSEVPGARLCRAYRGITYSAADTCATNEALEIPDDLGAIPRSQ